MSNLVIMRFAHNWHKVRLKYIDNASKMMYTTCFPIRSKLYTLKSFVAKNFRLNFSRPKIVMFTKVGLYKNEMPYIYSYILNYF